MRRDSRSIASKRLVAHLGVVGAPRAQDVHVAADAGDRRGELVARVGDEARLGVGAAPEPVDERVDGAGELGDLWLSVYGKPHVELARHRWSRPPRRSSTEPSTTRPSLHQEHHQQRSADAASTGIGGRIASMTASSRPGQVDHVEHPRRAVRQLDRHVDHRRRRGAPGRRAAPARRSPPFSCARSTRPDSQARACRARLVPQTRRRRSEVPRGPVRARRARTPPP